MSVFVKDMQMPSACGSCDFANFFSDGEPYCRRLMKKVNASSRLPECPLGPIPEHGDLIDRNALYKKAVEWEGQARHLANTSPDAKTFEKWSIILTERSAFKHDIADAPTIIPAGRRVFTWREWNEILVCHGDTGATTKEEAMRRLGLEPDKEDTNT